mmetsp:Transcript_12855/g.29925  ORF Transcript_12855/g.29925 Transcript_12855/m.29925 type:complete len:252 (+) Transcript_12855:208-963(+)
MLSVIGRAATRTPSLAIAATSRGSGRWVPVAAHRIAMNQNDLSIRFMSSDDLPYHIVVGMPALSPTMEQGTLAAWNVEEGQAFVAGDVIAKVDTDKASIDFEAQDDGHVAKLLVKDGTEDLAVGVPIMVTVEEAEDVAAFTDYVAPDAAPVAAAPAPAAAEPTPEPAAPAPTPPPPTPEPVVAAALSPEPVVAVAPPPPAAATPVVSVGDVPTLSPTWGSTARVASPIAKTLSAQQQEYVDLYGTTGQTPL